MKHLNLFRFDSWYKHEYLAVTSYVVSFYRTVHRPFLVAKYHHAI